MPKPLKASVTSSASVTKADKVTAATKAAKKTGPSKGLAYFSARSLERAVSKGTRDISQIAIDLVGYTVVEMKGWVVKEFEDGTYEKISKIERSTASHFVLD